MPFDRLVEELQPERRLGHMPLFQVMLTLQTAAAASAGSVELPELRVSRLPTGFAQARIDLAFTALQGEGRLDLAVEYNADLFDATTMRRLLARLATLAAACVEAPDRRLSTQPGVPASERHQVLAHAARRQPQLFGQVVGGELAPLLQRLEDLTPGGRQRRQRGSGELLHDQQH